jgi:ATP-dependent Clp protease protease subunit
MREAYINGRKDIRSYLMENDIIMLDGEFEPEMASIIMQQLQYLDTKETDKPITMYINSPGGCVISGLAIYDTIQTLKRDVSTVAVGMAASMGAFMLTCGGKKGLRYVTPNAQVMFHEVSAGNSGRVSDMEVRFEHTKKLNDKLHQIIAKDTGKSFKEVKTLFEKDIWLEAGEVLKFGAADKIIKGKG